MRRKRCSFTTLRKKQITNFHSIHILTVAVCHFSLTARNPQRDTILNTSIFTEKSNTTKVPEKATAELQKWSQETPQQAH
jgi:hypothetical protein